MSELNRNRTLRIMLLYIWYALLGIFSGFIGGAFGVAGGVLLVPGLYYIFSENPNFYNDNMQMALGTSLAVMVCTSASAVFFQHKRKAVLWPIVRASMPGLLVGSLIGSAIAHFLAADFLKIFFAFFAFLAGISYFFHSKSLQHRGKIELPSPLIVNILALLIATASNLLGIGGGIFSVPLLSSARIRLPVAIGTGSAIGLLIASMGSLLYILFGLKDEGREANFGYLNLHAFLIVGVTSLLTVSLGVKMAHSLPTVHLRRLFGVILISISLIMFVL